MKEPDFQAEIWDKHAQPGEDAQSHNKPYQMFDKPPGQLLHEADYGRGTGLHSLAGCYTATWVY